MIVPTNRDRADAALVALDAFTAVPWQGVAYPAEPLETRARDLITNLLHLIRLDVDDNANLEAIAAGCADTAEAEDDDDQDSCLTDGCDGDPNDGEGFDGLCGNCADAHDND
jgi:hypothetical protein